MPIEFTCTHCGRLSNVSEQYVGQTGPCAGCGRPITIPRPTSTWQCPRCQADIPAGAVACGNCGLAFNTGGAQQDIGEDAMIRMLIPVGRSGLAIAAGYAGLISPILLPAPIALLLGILAIRDIRRNPNKHGMGRAVFGLVMGIIFSVVLAVGIIAVASA